jgi:hypothetical protein
VGLHIPRLLQAAFSAGVPVLCPSARLVAQWRGQHKKRKEEALCAAAGVRVLQQTSGESQR